MASLERPKFEVIEPPRKLFEKFREGEPWKKTFMANIHEVTKDPRVEGFTIITHPRADLDSLVASYLIEHCLEYAQRQYEEIPSKPIRIESAPHGSRPHFKHYNENNPYVFERAGIIFIDLAGGRFDGHERGENKERTSATKLVYKSLPVAFKENYGFVWDDLINLVERSETKPGKEESFTLPVVLKTIATHGDLSNAKVFNWWGRAAIESFKYAKRLEMQSKGPFMGSWLEDRKKWIEKIFNRALEAVLNSGGGPDKRAINKLVNSYEEATSLKREKETGANPFNILRLAGAYRDYLIVEKKLKPQEAEEEAIAWLAEWIKAFWGGAEKYSEQEINETLERTRLFEVEDFQGKGTLKFAFLSSEKTDLTPLLTNPRGRFKADVGIVMVPKEKALEVGRQLFIRFNEDKITHEQMWDMVSVLRAWERFKRDGQRYPEGLFRLRRYEDMPGDPFFLFPAEKGSFIAIGTHTRQVQEGELTRLTLQEVAAALMIALQPAQLEQLEKLYRARSPHELRRFFRSKAKMVLNTWWGKETKKK